MIPEWNLQTVTFTLPPPPPPLELVLLRAFRELIAAEEAEEATRGSQRPS